MATMRGPLSSTGCPGPERLAAFHEGRLPRGVLEGVAAHVARCPPCEATLITFLEDGDSFLLHLRDASRAELPAEEPECLRMQAAARALPFPPAVGTPAPPAGPVGPPQQLGQYRLLEILGRGGMGVVYKAMHVRLEKEVALKLLPAARLCEAAAARFRRETAAAGSLRHPNVVEATDAGEVDGFLFLVMELLDGWDLARLVRANGPLRLADACEAARQGALGLQGAHERGLVHRDVKPSNLLLTAAGVVKLLDLGLARLEQGQTGEDSLTDTGQVMGTADYMAPEQAEDARGVDIRADLYSLGCTLYKLLTGQPPFAGSAYDSPTKKILAHARAPVPPISDHRDDIPPGLLAVLDRLLAKDPADRFPTPAEAAAALEPFAAGAALAGLLAESRAREARASDTEKASADTVRHGRTVPLKPRAAPRAQAGRSRRRKALVGAIAAVTVAGLGLAALLALHPGEGPPAANVWHPLLKRPPAELHWENGARASLYVPDPKREVLRVDAENLSLLGLGTVQDVGYKLQVGVTQRRWTGGVGVFFGWQPVREDNRVGMQCQVIKLIPNPHYERSPVWRWLKGPSDPRKAFPFLLSRWHYQIWQGQKGGHAVDNGGLASTFVPAPDADEQILELDFGEGGLQRVRWGGKVFPELAAPGIDVRLPGGAHYGAFGVYNLRSTALYGNARWMVFERRTQ
jgi:eukaryotic-like serine/threonine-protein kinase